MHVWRAYSPPPPPSAPKDERKVKRSSFPILGISPSGANRATSRDSRMSTSSYCTVRELVPPLPRVFPRCKLNKSPLWLGGPNCQMRLINVYGGVASSTFSFALQARGTPRRCSAPENNADDLTCHTLRPASLSHARPRSELVERTCH